MNVEQYLKQQHVPFDVLPHSTTYSAQRTAGALHVPGENLAKTVVLQADDRYVLAVLPATRQINLRKAQACAGTKELQLAAEKELRHLFGDCELGAVPPFGSHYGLETIVDEPLSEDEHIVFDSNTHDKAIYMRYHDYAQLERPLVAAISGSSR